MHALSSFLYLLTNPFNVSDLSFNSVAAFVAAAHKDFFVSSIKCSASFSPFNFSSTDPGPLLLPPNALIRSAATANTKM